MDNELDIQPASPGVLGRAHALVRTKLTPLFFAGSSVMTSMAQLMAGIVIVRWIGPEDLGLWSTVRTAQVYAFVLLLGINNGLGRELPFLLGKGEVDFANRVAGTAFFCATMANILVVVAGLVCAMVFAHHGAHLVCAIVAVTLQIAMAFYQQIFQLTFRSADSFKKLTNIQVTEAVLSLATIPVVFFFGYYGMLGRTLLIAAVNSTLMFIYRPMRVKFGFDWPALKLLWKTGLPIFGLDYFKNSCGTLDKWVLFGIGGTKSVGTYYALAGTIVQTMGALPSALSSYTYPRMSYKFGQAGDRKALWRFGVKFEVVSIALTMMAAACGWVALPYLVPIFAPKYLEGLHAAQIVLISAGIGGATIIVDALWSMKIWRLMITFQVASALLFALSPIVGVMVMGKTLEAVAWGAVVGSLLRGALALGLTYYGTHKFKPAQAAAVLAT